MLHVQHILLSILQEQSCSMPDDKFKNAYSSTLNIISTTGTLVVLIV